MDTEGSITRWIAQLETGNPDAAQKLWEAYFVRMVDLALRRLHAAPRRVADEEDVALSAFNSFLGRARAGKFPLLRDRNNLWSLLVAITAHKCIDLIRRENRLKRRQADLVPVDLDSLLSQEPTPDFALQVTEQLEALLVRLDRTGDPELRPIALWKMEGLSTGEIAQRLDCVPRTVERKVKVIVRVLEKLTELREEEREG